MPVLSTLLRRAACALLLCLAVGHAHAQGLTDRKVTPEDICRALIWTGHLSVMTQGEPQRIVEDAIHSWQRSKNYPETKELPEDQLAQLLTEGESRRDSFGWAMLEDKSVGFSIGVPTRFTRFQGARYDNASVRYDLEGLVQYNLGLRYGDLNCRTLGSVFNWAVRRTRATFKLRWGDGFVVGNDTSVTRAACRTSGLIWAEIYIPTTDTDKYSVLLSAIAESLTVSRSFNPTATPTPRLDVPPAIHAGDMITASTSSPTKPKPAEKTDDQGRTDVLRRELRSEGADLSVEKVFAKVSPAVYVVRAGNRQGSAVAVSEHELLTNCHVVKETDRVSLTLEKKKLSADVSSKNEKADRCVLKTSETLEKWVSIRPYDDVKVGERALAIGTPQGLDLTVADGIVSSKRTYEERRLIQTSAPISQGSSGGGLFDAQGHLIGITTFQLRVGQNLNFAIAAEDFAREPAKK
ncbi:MAG TPA: serine protease [Reyranella sp.]|nr:serine protease [Reyranella sp.]